MQPPFLQPDPSSTGLNPKTAGLLCYLGGFITGIIFLVLEKQSRFVRLHAFQSIVVSAAFIVLNILFGFIPLVGWLLGLLLLPVGFVLWIGLMLLTLQGRLYKLPIIGDWSEQQANRF
ncbi:hypothetical protein L1N85_15955 [Paenibacillus alkaliterrae]|uniref:DUF4870 domain-containing protein n=1 Tax=Paenibacillus alkaliterrae TaxID=320909 RepID=UPI001F2EB50D|nr:hypothetical protein [Paenibacillus alkaliterrae]MCF2939911.1 hypothetical protein [Paenibacillus alkaliterrae]